MTTDTTPGTNPAAPAVPARDYTSEPQQVVLTLLDAMVATWPEPQTPTSLATRTDYSRDQCYRGLVNLRVGGWVEEGRVGWALAPKLTLIAETIRQRTADLLRRHLGTGGLQ